ncbi:hypothetical protein SDRG_13456 [Saprolegnia diclina VS20]|uniref:Transmembrane protein n=1 Tax=Saprolegnia diclina (strain VS20) TaxID=1156394 RepID=T0R9F1_SAPDV|nr:hypothetical protein SDRG_13456 [Saprolegnia diclina VS20]EQC28773.1 hypothetical protein SDRG_13456 [Saprolegnia diclina VS20]|eukprot:XP_008617768.1 hypothetical protein SDRG_13456 [Saprolegnia diclina VS20]
MMLRGPKSGTLHLHAAPSVDASDDGEDDGLYAHMKPSTTYCWKLRQSNQATEVLVGGQGSACALTMTLMLPRLLTGIPTTVTAAWTISMIQYPTSKALGLSELRAAIDATGIAGVEALATIQACWAQGLASCDLFSLDTSLPACMLVVPLGGGMTDDSSRNFSATVLLDRPGVYCLYARVALPVSKSLGLYDFAVVQRTELRPSIDQLSRSGSTETSPPASSRNADDKWPVIAASSSLFVLALLGLACLFYRKRHNALLSQARAPSDDRATLASRGIMVKSKPRVMSRVPIIESSTPFVYECPTATWAGSPDARFDDDVSIDTSFVYLAADVDASAVSDSTLDTTSLGI